MPIHLEIRQETLIWANNGSADKISLTLETKLLLKNVSYSPRNGLPVRRLLSRTCLTEEQDFL
jgi:hypothetical protein